MKLLQNSFRMARTILHAYWQYKVQMFVYVSFRFIVGGIDIRIMILQLITYGY